VGGKFLRSVILVDARHCSGVATPTGVWRGGGSRRTGFGGGQVGKHRKSRRLSVGEVCRSVGDSLGKKKNKSWGRSCRQLVGEESPEVGPPGDTIGVNGLGRKRAFCVAESWRFVSAVVLRKNGLKEQIAWAFVAGGTLIAGEV